jgi:hypothetical protein
VWPRGSVDSFDSTCAGKTGRVKMVRDQDSEGVANHAGPESCVGVRKGAGEALTGEGVGRVLSREIEGTPGCPGAVERRRQHPTRRYRKARRDPARSETPRMRRITLCGNREVPRPPVAEGAAGCIGKSKDAIR